MPHQPSSPSDVLRWTAVEKRDVVSPTCQPFSMMSHSAVSFSGGAPGPQSSSGQSSALRWENIQNAGQTWRFSV